jgi:hypothetical protein
MNLAINFSELDMAPKIHHWLIGQLPTIVSLLGKPHLLTL